MANLPHESAGLAPLSRTAAPEDVEHLRTSSLDLLSDRAKALVIGECVDMRMAFSKGNDERGVKIIDALTRRIVRGMLRYEQRPPEPMVDVDTTGWG
jgi:hypothetical protein